MSDTPAKIEQYLRYHMIPDEKPKKAQTGADGKKKGRRKQREPHAIDAAVAEIGAPYPGFCLVVDTETTSFNGQQLRFGVYQIRGIDPEMRRALAAQGRLTCAVLDEQAEHGLFYDPASCSEADVANLTGHAAAHGMKLMTRSEFMRDVLNGDHGYASRFWQHDRLIIGFNLPFDIGALAYGYGYAQEEFHGGFRFKTCDCSPPNGQACGFHPPLRIKPIASRKHMFEWGSCKPPPDFQREENGGFRVGYGDFLDVAQFARALLGPRGGGSLRNLCKVLNVDNQKQDFADYDGAIAPEFIAYAVRDVQSTWECYVKLRDEQYRPQALKKPMHKVYSEASVGKAYYSEFGFPRFMQKHGETIPPPIIARFMAAYYGGRSEVRIRREFREIIHTDFKKPVSYRQCAN